MELASGKTGMFLGNSHLGFFTPPWPRAGVRPAFLPGNDGVFDKLSQNPCQTSQWQVLEERDAATGNTTMQYAWSPVYVDAMISRDRDTDGNGSLDERLWVQQDANWNVTSVANGTGTVVERYVYDAFGSVTIYSANYGTVRGSSDYGFQHFHQGLRFDAAIELYDNFNRWYSPKLGRFTSADTLGLTTTELNLYRYQSNSSITKRDPTGNYWVEVAPTPVVGVLVSRFSRVGPAVGRKPYEYLRDNGAWATWRITKPTDVPGQIRYFDAYGGNEFVIRRFEEGPPIRWFRTEIWVNPTCSDPPPNPSPSWIEGNKGLFLVVGVGAALTSPIWLPWVLPTAGAAAPYLGGATAGGLLFFGAPSTSHAGEPNGLGGGSKSKPSDEYSGGYWGTGGQWVPIPKPPKPSVYQPPEYDPYDPRNDF